MDEPILEVDEIQGNILGGFNKSFQHLVFLRVVEPRSFKKWLAALSPDIVTAREVIAAHARPGRPLQDRRQPPSRHPPWVNIAFSHEALQRLGPMAERGRPVAPFIDNAFREGLAARSARLNDPQGGVEGAPETWKVGGPGSAADVVIIVAADDTHRLEAKLNDILGSVAGARAIFDDRGAVLSGSRRGHEHFGFVDGVSQPGIRGRLSGAPGDFLTPRRNPADDAQGKPGQDLLWPGEFVFGYAGQRAPHHGLDAREDDAPGPVVNAGPAWAKNGSFLVFRRLHQKVPMFHAFLQRESRRLAIAPSQLAAMLIGRWKSGAPLLRTPRRDNSELGDDDCANNHYEFEADGQPIPPRTGANPGPCSDVRFPQGRKDPLGHVLPLASHIRKVYPRDDRSRTRRTPEQRDLNEAEVQTHRLLRRGLPFGPSSASTPESPGPAEDNRTDRGLHFLAYMTSIEEQFEFVLTSWANNPDFKEDAAGEDPIIGQSNRSDRRRAFRVSLPMPSGKLVTHTLTTCDAWVVPTGGGYYFAPSISAIQLLASG